MKHGERMGIDQLALTYVLASSLLVDKLVTLLMFFFRCVPRQSMVDGGRIKISAILHAIFIDELGIDRVKAWQAANHA